MKLVKNALGRLVPSEANGRPQVPFKGVNQHHPKGRKAAPKIPSCIDYPEDGNKLVPDLKAALGKAGIRNGMTISTHHHFRDGDLLAPQVLILLIGERPGLGRADSLSAYMAFRPKAGDTDAERDVICNIFDGGGANPLEAGAYALRLAQRMREKQASGVKLRLMEA